MHNEQLTLLSKSNWADKYRYSNLQGRRIVSQAGNMDKSPSAACKVDPDAGQGWSALLNTVLCTSTSTGPEPWPLGSS